MMLNLMKPRVHKKRMRTWKMFDIQLSNTMKNMDIGELRPRQVNDDEDD